jgi:hypothetical protein
MSTEDGHFALAQRAAAALRAISWRSLGVIFSMRAADALRALSRRSSALMLWARALPPFRPPFLPPNLPRATAAGFFLAIVQKQF